MMKNLERLLNQPETIVQFVCFFLLFVHLQQNSLKFISQTEKKDFLFFVHFSFWFCFFVIAECLLSGSPLEQQQQQKSLCNVSGFQVDCTFNNIVNGKSRFWRKSLFSLFSFLRKINWQFNIEKFNSVFFLVKGKLLVDCCWGRNFVLKDKSFHSFNIKIRVNAVE